MMSHFGIKPVRGGSPPSDRRISGVIAVRAGALVQQAASVFRVRALFKIKIRKVEVVITRYVRSVRRVRAGENCNTRSIHPRWAMDE